MRAELPFASNSNTRVRIQYTYLLLYITCTHNLCTIKPEEMFVYDS